MTPQVAERFDALRTAHLNALAIAQEPIVTPEMRRESSDLRLRTISTLMGGHVMGGNGDLDTLKNELRDGALRRSGDISTTIQRRIKKGTVSADQIFKWSDQAAVQPRPIDHSFWWARTEPVVAPGMRAVFQNDGLHFVGNCQVHSYDGSLDTSFGATARFALQPERFPPTPPSGELSSKPFVELFGRIVATAPNWDLIQGDGIAECRLSLRQSLFRIVLGGNLLVAEATKNDVLGGIYLKNLGGSGFLLMPGLQEVPPVTYRPSQLPPTDDLFAEIEVRFNIHLNCTGASVACDPQVVLRTLQWEPTEP
jgi:hypothetical protein